MVEDKTSVYISHRMSSCRFCDEIIVFENGGVKERENQENILKAQGLYYELWNAQHSITHSICNIMNLF